MNTKAKMKYNLYTEAKIASFLFQLHKITIQMDIYEGIINYENYANTLCDHISQLLYSLWITGLKLPTSTTIPPGWGWGDASPEIRCFEVNMVQFGSKLGQVTSKLCSFCVQTSVLHFHCM